MAALRTGLTAVGRSYRRTLPIQFALRRLAFVHLVDGSDDQAVVVGMGARATFEGAIAVEQLVDESFGAFAQNAIRKNVEMTEGPDQQQSFLESQPDATHSVRCKDVQYASADFHGQHETSLLLAIITTGPD